MHQKEQISVLKEVISNNGEVYTTLRNAIVELYLQPGVILSIKDICEQLQMGRSPVRDALIRLDQEKLVTLLPQRGTMVSKIDLSLVEQERFLRFAVEEEVMKLFMACHSSSDLLPLYELVRQQQLICETENPDIRAFLQLDDQFHTIFYERTDKLFCLQCVENSSGHYRRMRLLTGGDGGGRLDEVVKQHNTMVTAFQTRDTDLMRRAFQLHLSKLEREERILIKKYPHLFNGTQEQEPINPIWQIDYLQTIKGK